MAELKAGGLAIVVGGKQNTPLIGRVVELERLEQARFSTLPCCGLKWCRVTGCWLTGITA